MIRSLRTSTDTGLRIQRGYNSRAPSRSSIALSSGWLSCGNRNQSASKSALVNCSSAERNTWKGAPCWICRKRLPEDPNESLTARPVSFWNDRVTSVRANCRSDAAATVGTSAARTGSAVVAARTSHATATRVFSPVPSLLRLGCTEHRCEHNRRQLGYRLNALTRKTTRDHVALCENLRFLRAPGEIRFFRPQQPQFLT
jgi:hypothetical protein